MCVKSKFLCLSSPGEFQGDNQSNPINTLGNVAWVRLSMMDESVVSQQDTGLIRTFLLTSLWSQMRGTLRSLEVAGLLTAKGARAIHVARGRMAK